MKKCSLKLTVLFQDPFWVGIFEEEWSKDYRFGKVIFGAEPTDAQLYEFILGNYYKIPFRKVQIEMMNNERKVSYKRQQRKIKKQLEEKILGTKAQNAMKAEYESVKVERVKRFKEIKEEKEERLFLLKQKKKKEKHNGH